MSSTWLDVPEAEATDGYGGDEGAEDYPEEMYGDGEGFAESDDDAESRYTWRRRRARRLARARRRRRAALARARWAARMPLGPPTGTAAVRQTEADVANLEVENRVQADTLESVLAAQRQQTRAGTNAAAVAAVLPSLLNFLKTSAPDWGNNTYFQAGLPLAPLLFVRPTDRGLNDRRLWAAAAVAGLAIAQDRQSKSQQVERLSIDRSVAELPRNASAPFRAVLLDRDGRTVPLPLGTKIEWDRGTSRVLDVDKDGNVKAKGTAGIATVTAKLETPDGTVLKDDFVNVKVV